MPENGPFANYIDIIVVAIRRHVRLNKRTRKKNIEHSNKEQQK